MAAQQQRDAATKIPGPTGTPPATRVLKRLWEDKKDTGDAQGRVKKVTMDHSVVIWVAGCLDLFQFLLSRILDNSQYLVKRMIQIESVSILVLTLNMMVISIIRKVLLLAVILLGQQVVDGKHKSVLPEDELLIEKLKLLNKPAVKSIKSEDGDIIDCVDIYKKPPFDHPLLKDHIIKYGVLVVNGSSYVAAIAVINVWNPSAEKDDRYTTGQMWLKNELHDVSDSIEVG
ncbi:hypothetical protein C4D60_Mb09t24570 [Musa balbisiana]|uniref:Neprosin activation peptide domain-containing protein n=1 Tax=Musa balbisiana TaxID=52838 RepID=A0A4S8IJJ8_MUSBA|nr:hypothetical protein C4D60_Mb09t24570 [Musa balbisiana]